MTAAVVVGGLVKRFGATEVLHGIDLVVEEGETVAVLGPNGAGKTTTVEILEGFVRRTAGTVQVLGHDPERPGPGFREDVGVVLQEGEPEPFLSAAELVDLYRGWYRAPRPTAELLDLVGLADVGGHRVRALSGGQRRRLDLALALVGDPRLLFLDEPTTGFDPEARRRAWDVVRELRRPGRTVVLTTHYLEEAEALADRVVVLAGGRVVADAPPARLGGRDRDGAKVSFAPLAGVDATDVPFPVDAGPTRWSLPADEPTKVLHELTGWALDRGVELVDLRVERRSLEDVYLELTA